MDVLSFFSRFLKIDDSHRQYTDRRLFSMLRLSEAEFNLNSQDVKIDISDEVIEKMRNAISSVMPSNEGWAAHVPSYLSDVGDRVNYLSMVVAIDYRHWGFVSDPQPGDVVDKRDFFAEIKGIGKCRGSQAMVEMLKSACERGVLWHTPGWLLSTESNEAVLREILTGVDADGSRMEIPDFEGRFRILSEIAQKLTKEKTDFASIFRACDGRIWGTGGAIDRLKGLHSRYDDAAIFNGVRVELLKLAQLTIIAVASVAPEMFSAEELGKLTICPDYQVPKALRHVGALSYSAKLAETVSQHILLERDGAYETEIRFGSVTAATLIQERIGVPTSVLDYVLWKLGRESPLPHHLCITQMY